MVSFRPLFRNPHLQTIAGHYWRRPVSPLSLLPRLHRTEPDVQVLVVSQAPAEPVGDVVMVHGLEGSGQAGYIVSLSAAANASGFAAHRFHMRTCGRTEHLCPTLYHAGLTSDLRFVLQQMRSEGRPPAYLVGFSLGGNVVLKLAGELGEGARDLIAGVCAVSTPLDLDACARRIAEPENVIYERRFVSRMRNRLCATGRYRREDFKGMRTLREMDDGITAPSFGFGTAENYYKSQSAIRFLGGIRVPALLIQSKDDTFIPYGVFESREVRRNEWLEIMGTEHGGHLGFLARGRRRFWADLAVMEWIGRKSNCGGSIMPLG
jgi:uncharacterized protein